MPGALGALRLRRLRQVHGAGVVVADAVAPDGTVAYDDAGAPPEGDALVAGGAGACAVVLTADCAPVALGSPEGIHGAVHVGWRGLVAGVIERAVATMAGLGASAVVAGLGPTIHPCCYRFGPAELDGVCDRVGPVARGRTGHGEPALDLPASVRAVLGGLSVPLVVDLDHCTACAGGYFSYRARGDEARQGLFVWRR